MSGYDYAFFRRIVGTNRGGGYTTGPSTAHREQATASGRIVPDAFVCTICGDGSAFQADCARCERPMESTSGETPPLLASRVPAIARRGMLAWKGVLFVSAALVGSGGLYWAGGQYPGMAARPAGAALVLAGLLLLLVNPTVRSVHGWLERTRIRRLVRKVARKLRQVRCVPISELAMDQSIQRIRGRVRVLEAMPSGDPHLAAALTDGLDRRCGRFELVDETGAALVDDAHLELWDAADPTSPVEIRDGDPIEIVGPCERRVLSDRDGSGGYRGAAEGVVFRHRGGVPVHVVLLDGARARPPRVRVPDEPAEVMDEPAEAVESERAARRKPGSRRAD